MPGQNLAVFTGRLWSRFRRGSENIAGRYRSSWTWCEGGWSQVSVGAVVFVGEALNR